MIITIVSLLSSIKLAMDAKSCMCTRKHLEMQYGVNRNRIKTQMKVQKKTRGIFGTKYSIIEEKEVVIQQ
jgi:hypothetical protein